MQLLSLELRLDRVLPNKSGAWYQYTHPTIVREQLVPVKGQLPKRVEVPWVESLYMDKTMVAGSSIDEFEWPTTLVMNIEEKQTEPLAPTLSPLSEY